nr:hypothetical protein [Azospirillum sp. INR13]
MRRIGSTKRSSHRARSPTVPQPRRSTVVPSWKTSPAPPAAKRPRFIRCQSVGKPSIPQYCHMGATTIRFFSVTPRMVYGVNSALWPKAFSSRLCGFVRW